MLTALTVQNSFRVCNETGKSSESLKVRLAVMIILRFLILKFLASDYQVLIRNLNIAILCNLFECFNQQRCRCLLAVKSHLLNRIIDFSLWRILKSKQNFIDSKVAGFNTHDSFTKFETVSVHLLLPALFQSIPIVVLSTFVKCLL